MFADAHSKSELFLDDLPVLLLGRCIWKHFELLSHRDVFFVLLQRHLLKHLIGFRAVYSWNFFLHLLQLLLFSHICFSTLFHEIFFCARIVCCLSLGFREGDLDLHLFGLSDILFLLEKAFGCWLDKCRRVRKSGYKWCRLRVIVLIFLLGISRHCTKKIHSHVYLRSLKLI